MKFWDDLATIRWNARATQLLEAHQPIPNGQAQASRVLTYLSLAQYRSAVAAEAGMQGAKGPSVSAAVGGASAAVLARFFPTDAPDIDWSDARIDTEQLVLSSGGRQQVGPAA